MWVPPHVALSIAEAHGAIDRIKAVLRDRGIDVADQSNDSDAYLGSERTGSAAWRSENRAALLAKVRHTWIDGVLKQSLWHDALITLRLTEQPNAVRNPYGLHRKSSTTGATIQERAAIQDIYSASG